MKRAMGIQLSPNVSARKDSRVLVPMPVRGVDGIALYAMLVLIIISDYLIYGWILYFILM
jgi:hypothetical protein